MSNQPGRISSAIACTMLGLLIFGTAAAGAPAPKGLADAHPIVDFSTCEKPSYPGEALEDETQGMVTMSFLVSEQGKVIDSKLDKSSGSALLDLAALEAIEQCVFKPAIKAGIAVDSWVIIKYVWSLEADSAEEAAATLKDVLRAARDGNPDAQLDLGRRYYLGLGVAAKPDEAIGWITKAANQGHAGAQLYLGNIYHSDARTEADFARAALWYRAAGELGSASAQVAYGAMLAKGSGVAENGVAAVAWFRKAAAQGFAGGEAALGTELLYRARDPAGIAEALEWLRKGAAKNDRLAQANLGRCYELGTGVEQDYAKAAALYKKPAMAGRPQAQLWLANLYEHGLGVKADKVRAQELRNGAASAIK